MAAALVLGGCAADPSTAPRLHSLVSAADAATLPARAVVDLRVAIVPAQVDQPQWLVRMPDDTLRLLEGERWASPLRDELRAGLDQALEARHGVVDAGRAEVLTPMSAGATVPGPPAPARVVVDVTRFESLPDREARLDAGWRVQWPAASGAAAPELQCRALLREPVGAGAPALAAGHRRALVALADRIAAVVLAGPGSACPG